MSIEHIINPTDKVKLAVVRQNGYAIAYIKNRTLEIEFEAIKNKTEAIKYIENPTEEMKLYVVRHNGKLIQYFKEKPSFQVQYEAIKNNTYALYFIDELFGLSDDLLLKIMNESNITNKLKYSIGREQIEIRFDDGDYDYVVIRNPSREVKECALKHTSFMYSIISKLYGL